jgi:hypothetical protein
MGLNLARQEDIVLGICFHPAHSSPVPYVGVIAGGANITYVNNVKVAQLSNVVIGFCGHVGTIVTSSNIVDVENLGAARMFDLVSGEVVMANIMTGSENVYLE